MKIPMFHVGSFLVTLEPHAVHLRAHDNVEYLIVGPGKYPHEQLANAWRAAARILGLREGALPAVVEDAILALV